MYLRGALQKIWFSNLVILPYWKLPKYFVAFLIGITLFFTTLMASSLAYSYILNSRILYGVTLNGTDYGNKSYEEAILSLQKVAAVASKKELAIKGTNEKVTLEKLGINFNVPQTAKNLLDKPKEANNRIEEIKFLIVPIKMEWVLDADTSAVLEELNMLAKDLVSDAHNATFQFNQGKLVIDPGTLGKKINLDNTLSGVITSFSADQLLPSDFKVHTSLIEPDITGQELISVLELVADITSGVITLSNEEKSWSFEPETILSWLEIKSNIFGEPSLEYNEQAIRISLEKITKEVNKNAKPTLISALDESIIEEGVSGKIVDVDRAVKDITSALSERAEKEKIDDIALVVVASESAKQKVYPDTTPGLYEGKYIEIDLSSQSIYQYEGKNLLGSYRISTGKWSTPTPIGSFTINNKILRAYSKRYGLYMPYWMAFMGSKYGLHELPEWPSGRKEGLSHLGTPVSHGCVRLGPGDAQKVYEWTDIGTPVVIHS